MCSSKVYVLEFKKLLYAITDDGKNIASHLNSYLTLMGKIKFHYQNCEQYDVVYLTDEPEDLEIWRNLVKLNRSLEPKE